MRKSLLFVTVATLGFALLTGSASAVTGIEERILMVGTGPDLPERVILVGDVFNGAGTRIFQGQGRQDWVFDQGTLFVRVVPQSRQTTFDERRCEVTIIVHQQLLVEGGTGIFEGATGSGSFTNTRRQLDRPRPDGCTHEHVAVLTVIRGAFKLTFPDEQAG